MSDPRDEFVSTIVQNRSFVDVGGLFEIKKERVSTAFRAGARELALWDVEPLSCPWWEEMKEHLRGQGINSVRFISRDIHDHRGEQFDVVYSSGVIYHCPNPLAYLTALKAISKEYVILSSTILPAHIEGGPEFFPGSVLYIPGVPLKMRGAIEDFYERRGRPEVFKGSKTATISDWYPNWWMPTLEALKAMCENAELKVVREEVFEDNIACTLLLKAV